MTNSIVADAESLAVWYEVVTNSTQGFADRINIGARAGTLGKFTLLQVWAAADKLDHVEATLQFGVGVIEQFAVFRGH
jgi:hypothetical protein